MLLLWALLLLATLEGHLAERALELGQSCKAAKIRFWTNRRLSGQGKGGQPLKPLELALGQCQPALLTADPILPKPLRRLMDTLCMISYRAETAMTTAVAPGLDNPDTARSLLRSLFRGDASL